MKIDITIIVCTHNGANIIIDCLDSLKNQNFSGNFEVIIVDDGSTDNIQDIVNQYQFKIVTNIRNLGLAESRNIGIRLAKGEIIAFTDDDCVPDYDWIQHIFNAFKKNNNLIGISGKVRTYEVVNITQKYIDAIKPLSPLSINLSYSNNLFFRLFLYLKKQFLEDKLLNEDKELQISSVVGANMAFKKKELLNIGMFDKAFIFGGEEEELCYRFFKQKLGPEFILKYIPSVKVKHKFDRSFINYLKKQYLYGSGNARIRIKHKERSISLFPFPILILLIILFSFVMGDINIIIIFLLPFIFYFHWIIKSIKLKDVDFLLFPHIQFLAEISNNIGWLKKYFNLIK